MIQKGEATRLPHHQFSSNGEYRRTIEYQRKEHSGQPSLAVFPSLPLLRFNLAGGAVAVVPLDISKEETMAARKHYYRADYPRPGSGYVVRIADQRLTRTYNELFFCARVIQAYRILGSSREEAEQVALTKLKELRKVKHISSPKQD